MPFAQPGSLKMLRPTRSSAAYRYPLRRTGFWQHYLLDYDAYDTVGSTQKSTLSGAFLHVRFGSLAELCEHGLADLIHVADDAVRSEERRVGKECNQVCRSRWSPYH